MLKNVLYLLESTVTYHHYYRPQRSCGKVTFSQVSVILSTGGVCIPACTGQGGCDRPSWAGPQADTPLAMHAGIHTFTSICNSVYGGGCIPACTGQGCVADPLGRHPPSDICPGQTPPSDTPQADTLWADTPIRHPTGQTPPLHSAYWDTHTPAQFMFGYTPSHPTATAADGTHRTGMHSCCDGVFTVLFFAIEPLLGDHLFRDHVSQSIQFKGARKEIYSGGLRLIKHPCEKLEETTNLSGYQRLRKTTA